MSRHWRSRCREWAYVQSTREKVQTNCHACLTVPSAQACISSFKSCNSTDAHAKCKLCMGVCKVMFKSPVCVFLACECVQMQKISCVVLPIVCVSKGNVCDVIHICWCHVHEESAQESASFSLCISYVYLSVFVRLSVCLSVCMLLFDIVRKFCSNAFLLFYMFDDLVECRQISSHACLCAILAIDMWCL